jgi:hypothetical protein
MHNFKRSAESVKKTLAEKDNQIFTKTGCRIQFPSRLVERDLAVVGNNIFCFGCFVIILDTGEYAVMNANSMIELSPFKVGKTTIDEQEYYELYFDAGSVVIKTTETVKNDLLIYNVFDEFIFKGKTPWYMDYEDIGKLFDTAESHANSFVAKNPEVIEFIAAMIGRSKKDRTQFIRMFGSSYKDFELSNVDIVPLNSVFYSVNNTLNKISGNYFTDGVTSALTTSSKEVGNIEKILRA